jgi:FkbM family methyltransferase
VIPSSKKNMSFLHYIQSYQKFIFSRIRYLRLFSSTYKNYIKVMYNVFKKKYPITGILKTGISKKYSNFSEIYFEILNLEYNNLENSITVKFKNPSKKITLYEVDSSGDIPGIFIEKDYEFLPVKGKTVVDIGANIADSSIYFCLEDAKKVIALEPYYPNYVIANKNLEKTGFSDKVEILLSGCAGKKGEIELNEQNSKNIPLLTLEELVSTYHIESALLKIDCEGCEYDTILETPSDILRKFSHIQIEYHYGYKNLQKKLEDSGFDVKISPPRFFKSFNITGATVSIHKKNKSTYILSKKPKIPKMFLGWVYATRID